MKAARFRSAADVGGEYTVANPAPSSAIYIKHDIPIPRPSKPGELVIHVEAATVVRDNLTWLELYEETPGQLGNDFAGVVVSVFGDEKTFKPGDEVYGMIDAHRGGAWAEYALVTTEEAYLKPANLSWEEAAALPLSALTADQALFDHARLELRAGEAKRVLITGTAGGVGMFLVQFAILAGHYAVAATGSNARNARFLHSLGAQDIKEYDDLQSLEMVDAIIDTVGGDVLSQCWKIVKDDGALVSIDSSSWNFVKLHKGEGLSRGKENVHAVFFIVVPSSESMKRISDAVASGTVKGLVSKIMTLDEARAAYELGQTRGIGRGKVVIIP